MTGRPLIDMDCSYKLIVPLGVFAPTLFSKAYGRLVCEDCSITSGNLTVPFSCKNCHYDLVQTLMFSVNDCLTLSNDLLSKGKIV